MKSFLKPLLTLTVLATLVFGVAACTTDSNETTQTGMSSDQTLAYSTYIAGAFMSDAGTTDQDTTSNNSSVMNLSTHTQSDAMTKIEEELGEVNEYFQRLKVFLDNGMENPFTIDQDLDVEGDWDITMGYTVEGNDYIILLNEDSEGNLTGTLIMDGVEYDVEGYREVETEDEDEDADEEEDQDSDDEADNDDEEDLDEDADTEDDEDTDTEENTTDEVATETEEEIYLKTIDKENSDNFIEITIETEQDDEEYEFAMELESFLDGVEKEMSIEFEVEDDETAIEMELQNGNTYEFSRKIEDNDDIAYEFEYTVDGEEGEVELTITTNDAGEEIYRYTIEHEGEEKEVEFDNDDDDEDEDTTDEEDTDEDDEDTDEEETTTA